MFLYNNIYRITELGCWTKRIIGVMMSFEPEYRVSLQRKTSFRQKIREAKTTNFSKESEY